MKSLILSLLLSVAFSANAEIINNSQITVFGTPWGENFASWGPGNSIDDDPNTYWHGTNDLKIGMTDYLAYNFAKSYDIKKINFFNNEFDGYAIGELDIQISQDSTNGVDGRWVTIDHIDGDFNSANGDFSRSVNTGPVPWIRFLMNYQGRGAHGGSPAFLLSEVDFHTANERGLSSFSAQAIENEDHYNRLFCEEMQGEAEYVLEDLSRVDCLTSTHAFEADWADGLKVYEAIGQALYYASETGRLPGILLLIRKDTYEKHVRKVERVIEMYPDLKIQLIVRDVREETSSTEVLSTRFNNPQVDGFYIHTSTNAGVACYLLGCGEYVYLPGSYITGEGQTEVCKIWYHNELRDMGCGNPEPYITGLTCAC